MTDISNKDSEQDVKIAVLDSTLENATRRMELIHKRIDRTEERVTKLNEDVRERIRALEKWVWGAGAVLTAFIVIGDIPYIQSPSSNNLLTTGAQIVVGVSNSG